MDGIYVGSNPILATKNKKIMNKAELIKEIEESRLRHCINNITI